MFARWFDKVYIARLLVQACAAVSVGACPGVPARVRSGLHTSAAWRALRTCFCAEFSDPRNLPGTDIIDVARSAGARLKGVSL